MKNLSFFKIFRSILIFFAMILITIPMGFYGMYLYITPSLPDVKTLKKAPLLKPLQIYTIDEQLIAEFGSKLSLPVTYQEIPQDFIHAFLAAEDSSFFEHGGISFKSLGRAVSESITGADTQTGGSTITMQVAKNYFLTPDRTFKRKLTEIFLARHIEENLDKEEILTLYVNKIFLGKNAYGIQAAAQIYYDKKLKDLSIAQMAMLAGLPKAPSKYNPVVNPERALERRNWILGRMLQLGYINQAQYTQAIAEPIALNMVTRTVPNRFPYVAEMVRKELVTNFGEQAIDSGFKVYTTIDSVRQTYAENAVRKGIEDYDRRHGWRGPEAHDVPLENFVPYYNMFPAKVLHVTGAGFTAELQDGEIVRVSRQNMPSYIFRNANVATGGGVGQFVKVKDIVRLRPNKDRTVWTLVHTPRVQAQLISIHPNDGSIVAVAGGYNYFHSKFNRATQGWRQPGSIIKPFVYALALERGMTPHTHISDNAIRIGSWSPKNADGRYLGMMPLRRALYLSRNTVSVRLLQMVGLERTRQLFIDFGLTEEQIPRNYTIALGTPQVLPIQMATGYATFANGGYRVQPYFIQRIEDHTGKQIFKANPEYACIKCIADNKKITDMIIKRGLEKDEDDDENATLDEINAKIEAKEKAMNDKQAEQENATQPAQIQAEYRQAHRILKSNSAYEMAGILRDVIRVGTGKAALKIGRGDLGGKTGTTNDAKDAWFAGFNGQMVTVVWVGYDQPATLGRREYGGVAALPIWSNFMAKSLRGTPESWVKLDEKGNQTIDRSDIIIADPSKDKKQKNAQEKSAPPEAVPIYLARSTNIAPAPRPSTRNVENDFADLPGESIPEEIITPKRKSTPSRQQEVENKRNNESEQEPQVHIEEQNIRPSRQAPPKMGSSDTNNDGLENLLDGNM